MRQRPFDENKKRSRDILEMKASIRCYAGGGKYIEKERYLNC